jgi:hypothetical protein
MVAAPDFTIDLEATVARQLKSQRVGNLLGQDLRIWTGTATLAFPFWDLTTTAQA